MIEHFDIHVKLVIPCLLHFAEEYLIQSLLGLDLCLHLTFFCFVLSLQVFQCLLVILVILVSVHADILFYLTQFLLDNLISDRLGPGIDAVSANVAETKSVRPLVRLAEVGVAVLVDLGFEEFFDN